MAKENRKIGNDLERKVALILSDNGYWVHNFNLGRNGQPVDIIAVKDRNAIIIEVKHCEYPYFDTNRIEENQLYSIGLWWTKNKNTNAYFAFGYEDEIYMVTAEKIIERTGRIQIDEIKEMGVKLEVINK